MAKWDNKILHLPLSVKRQNYVWPLLSSQLLSTLFLLCPWFPFILFNSDMRDLPPRKLRALNLPLACVIRVRWVNRHMAIAAGRKGCKKKIPFLLFLYRNSSTNLTETCSLIMHNEPPLPRAANCTVTNRAEFLPHAPHFTPWKYTKMEGIWQPFLWAELLRS